MLWRFIYNLSNSSIALIDAHYGDCIYIRSMTEACVWLNSMKLIGDYGNYLQLYAVLGATQWKFFYDTKYADI